MCVWGGGLAHPGVGGYLFGDGARGCRAKNSQVPGGIGKAQYLGQPN